MTVEELAREVRSLKHRLDLAETRLSQIEGRFEFVSGQLRDIQLYQHSKFAEIDNRLEGVEGRLERVEGRLEKVEGRLEKVEGRLEKVEGRLERVEGRLERVEGRLDRVETGIAGLTAEVRALPRAIAEMIANR